MGIFDVLNSIVGILSPYGVVGLFALTGWALLAFFLWRTTKQKNTNKELLDQKDKVIDQKDKENDEIRDRVTAAIKETSDARIADLKSQNDRYTDICNETIRTLDKLIVALNVSQHLE